VGDSRAQKFYPVSWEEVHRDGKALAWRIQEKGRWKGLIAITRGGLVPAAIVARELDILVIESISVASYNVSDVNPGQQDDIRILKSASNIVGDGEGWLVVDDLVDTGRTFELLRRTMPKAHFASIYTKPMGRPMVDTFVTEVSQSTWINFPWEETPQSLPSTSTLESPL
jgi:xanthine phosphoribosyltransferase